MDILSDCFKSKAEGNQSEGNLLDIAFKSISKIHEGVQVRLGDKRRRGEDLIQEHKHMIKLGLGAREKRV